MPTLKATRNLFYTDREIKAGEVFEATPIDAQHWIRKGKAVPYAAEPKSVVDLPPAPAAEPVAVVEDEAPAERPFRRAYRRRDLRADD